MTVRKRRILTISEGTGQFALLSGLRDLQEIQITAVISVADSGESTGRLRDELGILPLGDALKCILAPAPYREVARNISLKRFVVTPSLSIPRQLKRYMAQIIFLSAQESCLRVLS